METWRDRDLRFLELDSPEDPRLADYRSLRERELRTTEVGAGRFIAEGKLVVERLFSSRYRVRSAFVRIDRLEELRPLFEPLPPTTPIYCASAEVFARVSGVRFHQGVLAVGEEKAPLGLDEILERATRIAVLASVVNHDNIGGVFRDVAALAGAAGAVLLDPRSADPLYRKSIRVSMGWALHVPFARLAPFPEALERLREQGFRLLALSPREGARDIGEIAQAPPERAALLLGAEGAGLERSTLALADEVVRVPIARGVDSLNLSVACAITLHALGAPRGELGRL